VLNMRYTITHSQWSKALLIGAREDPLSSLVFVSNTTCLAFVIMFVRRCIRLNTASCSPIGTGALRLADATSWHRVFLSHEAASSSCWALAVRSYSAAVPVDDGDSNKVTNDSTEKNPTLTNGSSSKNLLDNTMKPSEVVAELDRHIVGQHDAKRAVAIAMRNRWRRRQLPEDLRKEVTPRNVLLVGPTGTLPRLILGVLRRRT
jgi:hypothetical protein